MDYVLIICMQILNHTIKIVLNWKDPTIFCCYPSIPSFLLGPETVFYHTLSTQGPSNRIPTYSIVQVSLTIKKEEEEKNTRKFYSFPNYVVPGHFVSLINICSQK
jgi:hypothetical protein